MRRVRTVGGSALLAGVAFAFFSGIGVNANAQVAEAERTLRVCADPNNMPLSNDHLEGYENKIAQLLAESLGWRLEYTWFPQRMGFVRNTLRGRTPDSARYKCDLIAGVPVGFDAAATTKPYLRSTYAMVYLKGRGLDSVRVPDDLLKLPPDQLHGLRLGAFTQTPPVDWLLQHKLMDQLMPYHRLNADSARYPGEIIETDLANGVIDVAFVWGPIAGYFGKKVTSAEVAVIPFPHDPKLQFDYQIAMGVRHGEKEWKERVEQLIETKRAAIQEILAGYDVPQLDEAGAVVRMPKALR